MPFTYDYPHMALTADAVLLAQGAPPKVLLIQRAKPPFQGRWAIPGGFVDMEERIADAAARELAEETGVTGVALNFLGYFDAIGRDPRERTLSLAFWGAVADEAAIHAAAADDAAALAWHPVDRLPPLAFDHADILAAALAAASSA
ncbi:MAG: NUDIX hydrolase [Proteobacteria bacterium]|nr:NUDIX hydrolase [Pseudomonadota bacterium]